MPKERRSSHYAAWNVSFSIRAMKEKLIRREYVFRGRIIKVRLDHVELDGVRTTREIVEHPGAVVIVALDDAQRVLLVRQYRQAVEREMLELPAGTLDKAGENPDAAAKRELEEETGFRAQQWEFVTRFNPSPGVNSEEMYLYLARELSEAKQATEEDESIGVERMALADAVAMIERGEIRDAKTIVGLLLIARRFRM